MHFHHRLRPAGPGRRPARAEAAMTMSAADPVGQPEAQ
jgi:hypothetical protein